MIVAMALHVLYIDDFVIMDFFFLKQEIKQLKSFSDTDVICKSVALCMEQQ